MIQVLYEDDLNPDRSPEDADRFLCSRLNNDAESIDFACALLAGVRKHRVEIDKLLVERADNWTLERMAVTDRNILRLGAYEMLYGGTPERVWYQRMNRLAEELRQELNAMQPDPAVVADLKAQLRSLANQQRR